MSEDEDDRKSAKFVASKWEQVQPEDLEKQGIGNSKLKLFYENELILTFSKQ